MNDTRNWVAEYNNLTFIGRTMVEAQRCLGEYLKTQSELPKDAKIKLYREGATEEEKSAPVYGYY